MRIMCLCVSVMFGDVGRCVWWDFGSYSSSDPTCAYGQIHIQHIHTHEYARIHRHDTGSAIPQVRVCE